MRIDTRWASSYPPKSADTQRNWPRSRPTLSVACSLAVGPLLQATRTIPIVFPVVADPVAAGFVESLARPGGNATGFLLFEYGMAGNGLSCSRRSRPA